MAKIWYLEIRIRKFPGRENRSNPRYRAFWEDWLHPVFLQQATCWLATAFVNLNVWWEIDRMNLQQLVKEAKHGSSAAQKCLYDAFCGSMMLVCRRYVKDQQDAEELMLNGFYKFFRSLASFQYKSEAELAGWIKKIMVNECLMFLRKKMGFILLSDSAAEDVCFPEEILDRLAAEDVFRVILELPAGYRTIFNLHAIEGWEHKEIAGMLGISEGTSKSQLNKARKLLQKKLSQQGMIYEQRKTK